MLKLDEVDYMQVATSVNPHTNHAPRFANNENVARMKTPDLLTLVNDARSEFGEPEVRRNVFVARCKDELEGEHYKTFVVQNLNNTESAELELTKDQCMYVLMRESKSVRRKVVSKLNDLEVRQPTILPSYAETLRLYADQLEENQRVTQQRDIAIATKAEIGSKREATAMATASTAVREVNRLKAELGRNAEFATITAVENATSEKLGKQAFRPLRTYCNSHGPAPMNVADPRYGSVKAWPAIAWSEVYGIDLAEVFGGEA